MNSFDYFLSSEAIAQVPVEPRDSARLLVAIDPGGAVSHRRVRDLPQLVGPGDLLVLNETRVLPARLGLRKQTGGSAEVLLLEPLDPAQPAQSPTPGGAWRWRALVRPGRRLAAGTVLFSREDRAEAVIRIGERLEGGTRAVELVGDPWRHGEMPLPPYIREPLADAERYQTVYATRPGSVAAPTAGLHLTETVLDRCRAAGARVETVELLVGLDTFRPISVDDPADHKMHSERYRVPAKTLVAAREARRVIAVGTTSVRALEAAAATGELEGRTSLFIRGDYPFAVVDALLTNFHLPRSSLLLLVDAFVGPRWRDLYRVALDERYRFLSFGDAMLIARADHG
jgi:S-adenosylmethionine:tRNA ribosyltransferase-isomerase